jgi:hypothetical protein
VVIVHKFNHIKIVSARNGNKEREQVVPEGVIDLHFYKDIDVTA